MKNSQEFHEQVGKIEKLVQRLEAAADPGVRGTARELIQTLMELHGAGLERMLELTSDAGEPGAALIDSFGGDPLVSSLLVLYGLHPDDFETRVQRGVENARKLLRKEGARLEVNAISDASVHLKITGSASGNLQQAVREAILETAPDADEVAIEGGVGAAQNSGFVPLATLLNSSVPVALAADAQSS